MNLLQYGGHPGEKLGNAAALAVQAVKEVNFLNAVNQGRVIAAVQRHIVLGTVLPHPGLHLEKALVQVRLGQQIVVQVGMPGAQHQNHRGTLAAGVPDKGVESLALGVAQRVEALHVYAVECGGSGCCVGQNLLHRPVPEFLKVEHTAVRPLDVAGLVHRVALHRVEVDGVAVLVGDGGLAPVFEVVVHIALEVGRFGQCLPQLHRVGGLVVGLHPQHVGQKFVVQFRVGAVIKGGLVTVKDPRVHAPQKHLRRFAVGDHLVIAGHAVPHVGTGDAHVEKVVAANQLAGELKHTAGPDADHFRRFRHILGVQLDHLALVHLVVVGHVIAFQHQVHNAPGSQRALEQAAAVHIVAEIDHEHHNGHQKHKADQGLAAKVQTPYHSHKKAADQAGLFLPARCRRTAGRMGGGAPGFCAGCPGSAAGYPHGGSRAGRVCALCTGAVNMLFSHGVCPSPQ